MKNPNIPTLKEFMLGTIGGTFPALVFIVAISLYENSVGQELENMQQQRIVAHYPAPPKMATVCTLGEATLHCVKVREKTLYTKG